MQGAEIQWKKPKRIVRPWDMEEVHEKIMGILQAADALESHLNALGNPNIDTSYISAIRRLAHDADWVIESYR